MLPSGSPGTTDADADWTVVKSESVRNIVRERRMLEHVNHPFICNLRYSFQDIEYMYAPHPVQDIWPWLKLVTGTSWSI